MPYKNPPPCSVDGCDKPVNARKLCSMHYMRWRQHGDVNVVLPRNSRVSPPCKVDGCETTSKARGWCAMHYDRWRSNGDPLISQLRYDLKPEERFWAKVDKTDTCWLWTAALDDNGYGSFRPTYGAKSHGAHRYAYELCVGPVLAGLHLDHLCRNRRCVRPSHLEPVTSKVNTMRSPIAPASINARKTHCPKGHPYSGGNVYVYTPKPGSAAHGGRVCRACQRDRLREWRASRQQHQAKA